MVGLALLSVAIILALISFAEWAHMTYTASTGTSGPLTVSAALSGFGSVSVTAPSIEDSRERSFVERNEADVLDDNPYNPGAPALIVGLIVAGASWTFLQTRHRLGAAITIVVLSALELISTLWLITNVRATFNAPAAWSTAHYSPGFGLITATVVAAALVGLGVTALVLELRTRTPT
jgi:hypothetical protein